MKLNTTELKKVYVKQAMRHDKRSDGEIWNSAIFCWLAAGPKTNGRYADGSIDGLAGDLNRERDTVEDRIHGYELFVLLCNFEDGKYRDFVFQCRTAPYIQFSHFRALYDLQSSLSLTDADIISTLLDVYQAEGGITSRSLEDHMRIKFGKKRDWTWYARKALKSLINVFSQPDLPNTSEEIGKLYKVVLILQDGDEFTKFVVSQNPKHAEQVARKELAKFVNKETFTEASVQSIEEIDGIFADSRHIIGVVSSWLGDNA